MKYIFEKNNQQASIIFYYNKKFIIKKPVAEKNPELGNAILQLIRK